MARSKNARIQRSVSALSRGTDTQGNRRRQDQRTRLLTRALPLLLVLVLLVAAITAGVVALTSGSGAEKNLVRRYVADWAAQDYVGMYRMLSPASTSGLTEAQFRQDITGAAATATLKSMRFSRRIKLHGNDAEAAAAIKTSTFGTLRETANLRLSADHKSLLYTPSMVFPGLRGGEKLTRTSVMGKRGDLLASNGQPLAVGATPGGDYPSLVGVITGTLESIPTAQRAQYEKLGYPSSTQIGEDGLEAIFQTQLAGTPGGTLRAGSRVLAKAPVRNGATVKTTINPTIENDVINVLGTSYSGMIVMNKKTGAVEAAVGQAFSDLQPPGSTFKIITASAALATGTAKPTTTYPYETQASIGGFISQNAAGESCGGTLNEAFATSCDTVFGPLGIQITAKPLLSLAEKFGFNQPTGIPGALESSFPPSITTSSQTALGEAAIGQWEIEASPLEIADVGATIANHGARPVPTFDADAAPKYVRVTSGQIAGEVQTMMEGVVQDSDGTGTTAQIPGYIVAGKTGTAELASTVNQQNDAKETDAWFVGYVVSPKSDIVACALFPADGYGADSAAPAVKAVLADSLGLG